MKQREQKPNSFGLCRVATEEGEANAANALTNLVYNIFRYVQINHYQPQLITCKG